MVSILSLIASPLLMAGKPGLCFDHVRRIGGALTMYADQYDGLYPRSYEYSRQPTGRYRRINWSARLAPFLPSQSVFRCPADPSRPPIPRLNGVADAQAPVLSYVPNYAVMPTGAGYLHPVSRQDIDDPASLIAFAERQSEGPLKPYAGVSAFLPDSPAPGQTYRRVSLKEVELAVAAKSDQTVKLARVAWRRHDGLSNFAFTEGHVRALALSETLIPSRPIWGDHFYPSSP